MGIKLFLANYLAEGLLVTQGGTTESGAISNMMGKKVYESFLNMPDLQGNISNYNFSKPMILQTILLSDMRWVQYKTQLTG